MIHFKQKTAPILLLLIAASAHSWPLPSSRACPDNCTLTAADRPPCACTTSGRLVGSRVKVEFPGFKAEEQDGSDGSKSPGGARSFQRQVDIWLGVPYAQPPVGPLRFSRPEQLEQPNQWLTCQSARPACYQDLDPYYADTPGSRMWVVKDIGEDCLHLNVWAPRLEPNRKRRPMTTMVWLYGGSFITGGANLEIYEGRYLAASQGVIVVSMNYRNGPFGFLYLNTTKAPGNAGLWDQWLALKWVAANVAAFGGDPGRVTLFGESSGAVSVSLHTVSPWSQMLFQHAIMQSGGLQCDWGVMDAELAFKNSIKLAEKLNCTGRSSDSRPAIASCLSGRSPSALMRAFFELFQQQNYFEFVFSPTFDRDFLPFKDFNDLLANAGRHVKPGSQMFGYNKNEGTYFLLYAFLSDREWRATPRMEDRRLKIPNDAAFDEYLHRILNPFQLGNNKALYELVFQRAKFQYTEDDEIYRKSGADAYVATLDRLSGDLSFKCPVMYSAKSMLTNHSRVFFYEFDYRTEKLPWPKWMGVLHGYEIDFVFGAPFNRDFQGKYYAYNGREQQLSWYMMKYWANFAKTGDPNLSDHTKPFVPVSHGGFINWQPANGTRWFNDMPLKFVSQTLRTLRINASAQFEWSAVGARQLRDCGFWKWHVDKMYTRLMNLRPQPCPTV